MPPASGLFCEHKRLKTACPSCRPAPVEKPTAPAATKPVPRPSPTTKEAPESEAAPRPTGPGKPLMAKRKPRNKPVSAAEADHAVAWWVKKK